MATVPETQALLDELKAPSIVTPARVRNAIGAFVADGAEVQQQAAKIRQLLQAAEIAEANPAVDALLEEGFQKVGALLREAANAEKALRAIIRIQKELKEWDSRLRPAAQAAGYITA